MLFVAVAVALLVSCVTAENAKQPNFVVIFTDDQDALQNSTHPRYMPNLHELLRTQGVEFANYFVTTPVCCPSRTNLWRGQFSHNTNFTEVNPPNGGYGKWKELGIDKNWLPSWLQQLGYNTYYTGKFIVDYSVNNYNVTPAGFTDLEALVLPYTFDYNNPAFSHNGAVPLQYPGQYNTDVVAAKAIAQLQMAVAAGKPFLSWISPVAPHTSYIQNFNDQGQLVSTLFYPPLPAPRHWSLYSDVDLPRHEVDDNINEADSTAALKPRWIRDIPMKDHANMTYLTEVYRLRLRSLKAVDELIGRVVQYLNDTNQLDNTYIIFTSDNGYHVATHRFGAGKTVAYEEELNVPFIIRGPGLAPGQVNMNVGLHVDVAPTILTLAGAGNRLPTDLDGMPLPLVDNEDGSGRLPKDYPSTKPHRNQFGADYWGRWSDELLYNLKLYPNNTWRAVRVYDEETQEAWKLIQQCTGEKELYNLQYDPREVYNMYNSTYYNNQTLLMRLEALQAVLAVCKADSCRQPWKVVHGQDTSVAKLAQAMAPMFDALYASIAPFRYVRCLNHLEWSNEISPFYDQVVAAAANNTGQLKPGNTSSASSCSAACSQDTVLASARRIVREKQARPDSGFETADQEQQTVMFSSWMERHAVPVPDYVFQHNIADVFHYAGDGSDTNVAYMLA